MMRGDEATPLAPAAYERDLLSELPILGKIAQVDTQILFRIDSSDMQPEHWIEIARAVHAAAAEYDGVVVIHGTDTMAYTASALAFLLPGLAHPVILTGSQRPIDKIRTDARHNLIDAAQLATKPIPEVGICFASKLLRGCRTTKVDAWGLDAFASPNCSALVKLGVGVDIARHVLPPRQALPFDDRLEPRVLAVRLFPGLDPELLKGALRTGVRGLVLKAFGAGNVPTVQRSLVGVIEMAHTLDVPVVITSQCLRAHVNLRAYVGGAAAHDVGAIGAGDMTDEAALTKLMITLGRVSEGRVRAARTAFSTVVAGEMTAQEPPVPSSVVAPRF